MTDDDLNFSGRDWRDLSPQQWTEARRDIYCRAHRMRSLYTVELLRKFAGYFMGSFARSIRFIRDRKARLKAARTDREAIARLQSLDDYALRDLGICRSEIESVVHSHGCDATRRRDKPLAA